MKVWSGMLGGIFALALAVGCGKSEEGVNDGALSKADVKKICEAEADARKRCRGNYSTHDTRAEYVASCVAEEEDLECGYIDRDAYLLYGPCDAEEFCSDDGACEIRVLTTLVNDHPERAEAAQTCRDLGESCLGTGSPEALDDVYQDCLLYLVVSPAGRARLDACVAEADCNRFSSCLFDALDCVDVP